MLLRGERRTNRIPGAAAIASALLLVYLVGWLSFSLRSTSVVDAFLPSPASLAPWTRVLRDEHIGRHFLNTLALALPTALLVPLVVFPAASWIARRDRRASRFVLLAVQVVLVYLARVLVPLSLPTIAASMIMGFLGAWNGFLAPLVFLSDDALYPISLKLFSLVGNIASGTPRWNLFAAGSLLNLALIAALTALLRTPLSTTPVSQYEGRDGRGAVSRFDSLRHGPRCGTLSNARFPRSRPHRR